MELQPDNESRSSLRIEPGSDDAVGFARSSLGDSSKGLGSSLGTRREITREKTIRLTATQDELNQLTKELVKIKSKPEFEKWREPLL
ncbi:hypothetical protein BHM03_00034072 [Ensete ventricosum]|nr:hypothetical protein BHM03_00034072 [Ensete ventricosum]